MYVAKCITHLCWKSVLADQSSMLTDMMAIRARADGAEGVQFQQDVYSPKDTSFGTSA